MVDDDVLGDALHAHVVPCVALVVLKQVEVGLLAQGYQLAWVNGYARREGVEVAVELGQLLADEVSPVAHLICASELWHVGLPDVERVGVLVVHVQALLVGQAHDLVHDMFGPT